MFSMGEKFGVNCAASDDKNLLIGGGIFGDKSGEIRDREISTLDGVTRNDDIGATGEFAGERIPSFAPHDDFVVHRSGFEKLQIFFDMKKELASRPKLSVFPDSGDETKHSYSVTGILMVPRC